MRCFVGVFALALAGWMPAQGIVTILVHDLTGQPVSSAGVALDHRLMFIPGQSSWPPEHFGRFYTRRRAEVHFTNAEGLVTIRDIAPGEHEVWCLTNRGAGVRQMVTVTAENPSPQVLMTLDPRPIKGRVTNREGEALEGVEVQFASAHRGSFFEWNYREEIRVTDSDGKFAVPALGIVVIVGGGDYASEHFGARPDEFINVVLPQAVTLEGQIIRSDGTPAHCTDVVLRINWQRGTPHIGTGRWSGRTDEGGRFIARGLQPKGWTLRAWGAIQDQTFEVDLSESQELVFRAGE